MRKNKRKIKRKMPFMMLLSLFISFIIGSNYPHGYESIEQDKNNIFSCHASS